MDGLNELYVVPIAIKKNHNFFRRIICERLNKKCGQSDNLIKIFMINNIIIKMLNNKSMLNL